MKKTTKPAKTLPPKHHHFSTKDILSNVLPTPMIKNGLSSDEKIKLITEKFTEIMEILGLDLNDDSLKDTPRRVAKMYVNEIFSGLDPEHFPKMTVIENKMEYDQMICVSGVSTLSFCEHHFLTIDGVATVAYIPNKKVIGLSKINRIVQFFSRRPQVQERLTKQIADCLQYVLDTEHVAVYIDAKHYCVIARGIEDTASSTVTTEVRGHFRTKVQTREEFLHQCKRIN
ncbi:GTP cyclohydrolase I FolE [Bdellovibrio sp. HCB337]|uniref:GTP cyclohydrolase I FolE n=1 Tax=Bdellovibrio sp. HCB337 TaxID=3394358 RepID=UPI0039A420A7